MRLLSRLKKNEDRAHIKIPFVNPSDTTHQMASVKNISSLYLIHKRTYQCNYSHAAHHHTTLSGVGVSVCVYVKDFEKFVSTGPETDNFLFLLKSI